MSFKYFSMLLAFLALIVSTLIVDATPAQNQIAKPLYSPWGLGLINNDEGRNKNGGIVFSQDTLTLYMAPKGMVLGSLYPNAPAAYSFDLSFSYDTAQDEKIAIDRNDSELISSEGTCLKFYDTSNGYVEVLRHTFDGLDKRCWIKVADLQSNKLEPELWVDFFLSRNQYIVYYNRTTDGLRIMSAPSSDSALVMTLTSSGQRIMLTGQRKDNWLQVKVSDKYLEMGFDNATIKWTVGWIKTTDEKGRPNIWYYPKGC